MMLELGKKTQKCDDIWALGDHHTIYCNCSTVQKYNISLLIVLEEIVDKCLLQFQYTFTEFLSTEERGVPSLSFPDNF